MLKLLGFESILNFLPLFIMPVVFGIVIVVVVVTLIKRAKAEEQRRRDRDKYQFTDGNGRTAAQNDYLNAKRRELVERKLNELDNAHGHKGGKTETYDKIVGSLGEVNDEGCDDLDGVRLIEHDEAYCDDDEHIATSDTSDLERAIVLGEVLNTPRFKQMYRRK